MLHAIAQTVASTFLAVFLLGTSLLTVPGVAECQFPAYLWESFSSTWASRVHNVPEEKRWVSRTLYPVGDSVNWTSRREMDARRTHLTIKAVTKAVCLDSNTNSSVVCDRKDLLYHVDCLSASHNDIYRVQIRGGGITEFSCWRFVERGSNVVQLWKAYPSATDDDGFCIKSSLHRDIWPWTVQRRSSWSFCPFTGGFDLRVFAKGKRKRACRRQWRPSRLESECILGEGITVRFPDTRCTVLDRTLADGPVYCWGGWTEGDYIFAIIGRLDTDPQYTLRLPKDVDHSREFSAKLYNAPVSPLRRLDERSLDGVVINTIHLLRSDAGVCYDESEFCPQFARDGKCVNSALHKFANFCKKACGLCGHKADLVPSVQPECHFPEDQRGRWLLFETRRHEEVVVDPGHVTFSQLGSFICKSKHWRKDQYKTLSVYANGCRPRYTCVHFRLDGAVLYYQLSRSSLLDRSFDLCQFRDDPEPLHDKIRSRRMKILLPEAEMRYNDCGLHGLAAANLSFADDSQCTSTVSDWDAARCMLRSSLTLAPHNCRSLQVKEYRCLALSIISAATAVLITQDIDSTSSAYQCWMVHTYSERMSYRPWKRAYIYDRGQCGTANDIMALSREEAVMTVDVARESLVTMRC